MDDESIRRRRQNEQSQYTDSDQRYGQHQSQGRGFSSSSSDRFRPPPPITTSAAATRGILGGSSGYGYYTDSASTFSNSIPASAMQYQTDYSGDQRQQQNFASYTSGMMYGANQQTPQSTVYDQTGQLQSRQSSAMQMVSDVSLPYYGGDQANSNVPPILQHQASSGSTSIYQQSAIDRNQLLQSYTTNMSGIGTLSTAPTDMMDDSQQYESGGLDEAYSTYQTALKGVFLNIRDGMLAEASSSLLDVSDWLLSHVGDLGLTADDENLHSDRITLWNQFNTAWLAVLQRQKEMVEELLQTGATPRHPQSLISSAFLDRMAKELIRLCDNIEKHGLVDYQYGVWEEQIINILTECADLASNFEDENLPGPSRVSGLGRAPP